MAIDANIVSYAQVGHSTGGYLSLPTGNIAINADADTADVIITADGASETQVGHFANGRYGPENDNIAITAGRNVMVEATSTSTATVGHIADRLSSSATGRVKLSAGQDLIVRAYGEAVSKIGHQGDGILDGNITLLAERDIFVETGNTALAQVGHGSPGALNLMIGDILLDAKQHVTINADGSYSTTQIGHGGREAWGIASGNIRVIAGADGTLSPSMNVWANGAETNVQIGHGGNEFAGLLDGNIEMQAAGNMEVWAANTANAQVGHGGNFFLGAMDGSIAMQAAGNMDVAAMSGATTQIGHGGNGFISALPNPYDEGEGNQAVPLTYLPTAATGDISLLADGNMNINATGIAYTGIGHGGPNSAGGLLKGDITVITGKDLILGNPTNDGAFTLISHGGPGSTNPIEGNILMAFDEQLPGGFGGGRFIMSNNARIGVALGLAPTGDVKIFGSRVLPQSTNYADAVFIADGAVINGIEFNSDIFTVPRGMLIGTQWNNHYKFFEWTHEQYNWVLADRFDASLPYTGPFTFFFVGPGVDPQLVHNFDAAVYDRFGRYEQWARTLMQMFPNGPYFAMYGPAGERPEGEVTGSSSYDTFGQ